ncbi:uncharacterized protein PV07_02652 [Cladophialophora immunda]|uniref:Uncharacterized protein n=1 Tax=Cladophialophora immunda TaxID=569365 RepID=A0A0D1ZSF1_9EURO|nr:uncharacterized protein PV07_02652 [Cladophialophora immunda]KIW30966.1 hypothetical protein PV07_02652 [Cladophialophora immunda]OQV05628.1 hypothetical protein CLAIMM_10336 isoform 1 [Cladophialophora immunda]OQV05629.1 hypothetical protein CLAIMM_10336 isoform 2 [Cladophialophora immunda]OQV05630.1 hypothetical protein CLAIMM_10336 isoform 3 [Cladophialophora immunda]OQV05631.1 hypothetical protein CLAIMM_10336 isoform 4 [Cladophialophora immunda]
MPIISRLVKGIGAGIGAASEAIADHKEKKAARERAVSPNPLGEGETGESSRSRVEPGAHTSQSEDKKSHAHDDNDNDDSSSVSSSDLDNDTAEWALDEAAEELEQPPPTYEQAAATSPASDEEVARAFLHQHKVAPIPSETFKPLPCPVILPQRRPKDKTRGFVRAYAPLLGECAGIDQKTFIDFINDLDRASKASPVFDVINLACFAVGLVPNPITMAVSIAIQVASGTGKELQSRYRRNTYLDQINESLFKPRGLYCMIMTFKPDNPHDPILGMDLTNLGLSSTDQALVKATSIPDSELKQKLAKIRLTSGVSRGELSLPESAPLVYPALDAAAQAALDSAGGTSGAAQSALPQSTKDKLHSSSGFLASYLDRRAQASYAGMHPDSRLVMPPPEKKFASRFSDPNHPANSGTILGLLTGGHFDPKAKRRGRKAQRHARWRGYELSEADVRNAEMGRLPRRHQGLIRRVLHKNILYLTVVSLPSESEIRENMLALEKANK